uniref:Uncharacterized protein n=1 Tax=Strombidium inclinatum TaxID=197538 RepID=A0A7S3MYC9_9SPIT|mmetsp:Transcript_21124/g.32758  ORF Transcript_21124/g.32758 Transcript_21124/m.32758 type:complete len:137 (+) Transcript_21124:3409-3819(+)
MIKRDSQQKRLQKKVDKLALDFEKNKRLEEKKVYKEHEAKKKTEKQMLINKIETFYKDKINMLKDRITQEKMERNLAEEAQKKAVSQRKKELDDMRRREVQRYIQILQQQDDKFDVNNLNLGKYENEVLRFYKKSK